VRSYLSPLLAVGLVLCSAVGSFAQDGSVNSFAPCNGDAVPFTTLNGNKAFLLTDLTIANPIPDPVDVFFLDPSGAFSSECGRRRSLPLRPELQLADHLQPQQWWRCSTSRLHAPARFTRPASAWRSSIRDIFGGTTAASVKFEFGGSRAAKPDLCRSKSKKGPPSCPWAISTGPLVTFMMPDTP
jgi:hypothetical protein